MATVDNRNRTRTETEETDFYLPATSISAALDQFGSLIDRTIGRHGLVLIPDSYNK